MRRKAVIGVAAFAIVGLLGGGIAAVGGQAPTKVKSKLKFKKLDGELAKGVVKTPGFTRCQNKRKVVVFVLGALNSGSKQKVAADKTNKKGRWKIVGDLFPSGFTYLAKVRPKTIPSGGLDPDLRCRAAKAKRTLG